MKLAGTDAHLTYCTNIHPGESWAEVRANVEQHVVAVKARVSPDAPFGVGLRLSARAADDLLQGEGELASFKRFLDEHALYVFTINGFPYGAFHGARVKENVYLPDWRAPARGTYTASLAEILAQLLPVGMAGSISTVPGAFRSAASGLEDAAKIAAALVEHAAWLAGLSATMDRDLLLALEPEPMCFLQTTDEAVRFFEEHLFARAACARFAELTGESVAAAERGLRKHLGLCFDACHAAVEFEDARASLDALVAAGISIGKIQVTTALESRVEGASRAELRRFDDEVYLHQVVVQTDGQLLRFVDLPEALASAPDGLWRTHFHVPVFQRDLGHFTNTQPHLQAVLARARALDVTQQYEVETYTWDVLPEAFREGTVVDAIARELTWTRNELARP